MRRELTQFTQLGSSLSLAGCHLLLPLNEDRYLLLMQESLMCLLDFKRP